MRNIQVTHNIWCRSVKFDMNISVRCVYVYVCVCVWSVRVCMWLMSLSLIDTLLRTRAYDGGGTTLGGGGP